MCLFPAGTVSGAPKIARCRSSKNWKPGRAGTLRRTVGYFGFSGNMDMCINIRTVVIRGGRHGIFQPATRGYARMDRFLNMREET